MASAGGCAMCQSSFDDQYAAYGGSQARADMNHGRVGSRFGSLEVSGEVPPEPTDAPEVLDDVGSNDAFSEF